MNGALDVLLDPGVGGQLLHCVVPQHSLVLRHELPESFGDVQFGIDQGLVSILGFGVRVFGLEAE